MSDGRAHTALPQPRSRLLQRALLLVTVSVVWGAVAGGFSLAVGLIDGSLGVLGVGLGVLADLRAPPC